MYALPLDRCIGVFRGRFSWVRALLPLSLCGPLMSRVVSVHAGRVCYLLELCILGRVFFC